MKLRVILFGATGMVGEGVLLETLRNEHVESVLVVGRRTCNKTNTKLKELIHHDFFNYSAIEEHLKGYHACYFCLGVSSVGMKEQEYIRTTYDLTMAAARTLVRINPGMTFCYVSGTGTDSTEQGRIMWARVKGRTENQLAGLPFKAVYLFRPGMMKPTDGQKNVKPLFRTLALMYPLLRALLPGSVCTLEELGLAMLQATRLGYPKRILENVDIALLAETATER